MALPIELFRDLPVQEIAAGQNVIEQGTTTGHLFVLIEGRVEIIKNGKTVAATAQPGDIFGDISALLKVPHTTSVMASRASKFHVVMDAKDFLEKNPVVCVYLCEMLARRLVSVTDYLLELKDQFAGHDHLGMIDEILDKLIHRPPRTRIPPSSSTIGESELLY